MAINDTTVKEKEHHSIIQQTEPTWNYQSPVSDFTQMQMMQAEWIRRAQASYISHINDINNSIVSTSFNSHFPDQEQVQMPDKLNLRNKQKGHKNMALSEEDQMAIRRPFMSYREAIDKGKGISSEDFIVEDVATWRQTKEALEKMARSVFLRYEKPRDVYVPEGTLSNKDFSYTKETTYLNLTDEPLFMQDSMNIISCIDPITNRFEWSDTGTSTSNSFIIVDTYKYPTVNAARKNLMLIGHKFSNIYDEKFSHEANMLHTALIATVKEHGSRYDGQIIVRLKRAYPVNEAYKDRVYLSSHDVVVTTKQENIYIPHPLSIERRIGEIEQTDILPGEMLDKPPVSTYKVEIDLIDNDNVIGERYIYVFGQAVKLKPHKNPNKANGAYMYNYLDGKKTGVEPVYTELDNLHTVHIYRTRDEAEHNGDHELRIKNIDLQGKQADRDKKLIEKERTTEELTFKIKELEEKSKNLEQTTQYEREQRLIQMEVDKEKHKSQKLETTNNVLKTIIATATAIVAGIALYNKFEKSGGFTNSDGLSCINL